MSDPKTLMNIGDLAKPVDTLIKRVSDAIGGIAKPWQTERVAKAEAKAAIMHAASAIELPEETKRAIQRVLIEETFKQNNMEEIIAKASLDIQDDARPEDMDEDWITNFFDKCRLISDEEMQVIWARILAGEANSPGQFAKRTINLLASFEKQDAELFQTLSCYFWTSGGKENFIQPFIYNTEDELYVSKGITYESLLHLQSLGLINFGSISGYKLRNQQKAVILSYFSKTLRLEFLSDKKREIDLGKVLLTWIQGFSATDEEIQSFVCKRSPIKD